jgi:hypothetical protein
MSELAMPTWEELNPDWMEEDELTHHFAKSQFANCPGCGKFEHLEVMNVSQDDEGACVACRPCQFFAQGECPSQAIDNWNRRVTGKTPTADIKTVFTHWQNTHAKQASKLDSKRTSRIRTALKTFNVEQLCQAIDGALRDDWLCGRDPKSNGRKYIGIETIFRDASQIERLIELGTPVRLATTGSATWDFPLVQQGAVIQDK